MGWSIRKLGKNNSSNVNAMEADKAKLSYWTYMNTKGKITTATHDELDKLDAYKKKCEERRNRKEI